jgi:hypothetical protein
VIDPGQDANGRFAVRFHAATFFFAAIDTPIDTHGHLP